MDREELVELVEELSAWLTERDAWPIAGERERLAELTEKFERENEG